MHHRIFLDLWPCFVSSNLPFSKPPHHSTARLAARRLTGRPVLEGPLLLLGGDATWSKGGAGSW